MGREKLAKIISRVQKVLNQAKGVCAYGRRQEDKGGKTPAIYLVPTEYQFAMLNILPKHPQDKIMKYILLLYPFYR